MLQRLVRFSLDNATLVLVLAGVLLVFAGYPTTTDAGGRVPRAQRANRGRS